MAFNCVNFCSLSFYLLYLLSILNYKTKETGDHIAKDHMYTNIVTCNIEGPPQKYRIGTVSNRLLGCLY